MCMTNILPMTHSMNTRYHMYHRSNTCSSPALGVKKLVTFWRLKLHDKVPPSSRFVFALRIPVVFANTKLS
eukprot:14797.XXX_694086_694362_1 [CDS] Oithona nana genome sequencing.